MVRIFAFLFAIALIASGIGGIGGIAATAAPVGDQACSCAMAGDGCDPAAMNGFSCQRCCIAATPAAPSVPRRMLPVTMVSPAALHMLVSLVTGLDPPPPRGR